MIGIIGAMDQEVAEVKKYIDKCNEKKIFGFKFYIGKIAKKDVVLMQSGVGKVMASASTMVLMNHFKLTHIINIGTAGALKEDLKPLDLVVSEKVANADFDLRPFGYGLSFDESRISHAADKNLLNLVKHLNITSAHFGDLVSTDTFISKQKEVDHLLSHFPTALCADMEAGSIATLSEHCKIPFIIIRSISDYVLAESNQDEFYENLKTASARSAKITVELINKIS